MGEMKTVHKGVEIAYDEQNDVWRFTLRGRARSEGSLAAAKMVINKPSPKNRRKATFEPCDAWHYSRLNSPPKKVRVEAILDKGYGYFEFPAVSISIGGKSLTAPCDTIFPSPANDGVVNDLLKLYKDLEAIRGVISLKEAMLKPMEVPPKEEE